MKILFNRGNVKNAKSYPYWDDLMNLLEGNEIREINGIFTTTQLLEIVNWCDVWVSIDSFLPHFCAYHKLKPGIVIWGKSDPELFGYKHNVNLLKDKSRLREDQYGVWKDIKLDEEDFFKPEIIRQSVESMV